MFKSIKKWICKKYGHKTLYSFYYKEVKNETLPPIFNGVDERVIEVCQRCGHEKDVGSTWPWATDYHLDHFEWKNNGRD